MFLVSVISFITFDVAKVYGKKASSNFFPLFPFRLLRQPQENATDFVNALKTCRTFPSSPPYFPNYPFLLIWHKKNPVVPPYFPLCFQRAPQHFPFLLM